VEVTSIYSSGFLKPKDGARLVNFSVDEFVDYLSTHDRPGLIMELSSLAHDRDSAVAAFARKAVVELASTSPLNRLRMDGLYLIGKNSGDRELP
jgi:hypothetical protein